LESLQRITYPNYQMIVVDNGSTDDSIEMIKEWAQGKVRVESKFFTGFGPKPVTIVEYTRPEAEAGGFDVVESQLEVLPSAQCLLLIRNDKNLGFSGGNNVAIRYALLRNYQYIALLNNDTVVTPTYLTQLIDTLEKNPDCIAVSPKILIYEEPTKIYWAGGRIESWTGRSYYIGHGHMDNSKWSGTVKVDAFSGCCFVAKCSVFRSIGLLDEDMFFGGEEFAYGWASKKHGFFICANLDSIIYHKWGQSWRQEKTTISPFIVYYARKSWLICVRKYGTPLQQLLYTKPPLQIYNLSFEKESLSFMLRIKSYS